MQTLYKVYPEYIQLHSNVKATFDTERVGRIT